MSLNADTWLHSAGILIAGNITFSNVSPNVTGAGSAFLSTFQPGDLIMYQVGGVGPFYYCRVLSVTNDGAMIMTANAPFSAVNVSGHLIPQSAVYTGDDGETYNLRPPSSNECPNAAVDGGKLFVPGPAVATALILASVLAGNYANWVAASPAFVPAFVPPPAADTLMDAGSPATINVIGQDGIKYTLIPHVGEAGENLCMVPRMAVNPSMAAPFNWTVE